MLRADIGHLDAILLTHNHKDHTGGLDDVRSLNYIDRRASEIFCERNVLEDLIREYPYVFRFPKYPGAPEWHVHTITEKPFRITSLENTGVLEWVHDIGYFYRQPDGSSARPTMPSYPPYRPYRELTAGFRMGSNT